MLIIFINLYVGFVKIVSINLVIIKLMAFVIESDRKINEISKTMCPLGPGQYFKQQSSLKKQQCAPFQSTTRRRSFLQPTNHIKPGPGNYQISKPFIEPNIKTVSNSQSIIVKINSTGTAQFKSVVDRFEAKDLQVPGPGNYYFNNSLSLSPRRKSNSQRSMNQSSIMQKLRKLNTKKNYPAIPEKIRGLTDSKKQDVNPQGKLGPAFYNPQKIFHLNSASTVWGKDKCKRFSVDGRQQVGPGKYNPLYNPMKPEDKIPQPSAHFKSNTVRTYFDSLFYKTNISETAKARDLSHFKTKDPAPGHYEVNVSSLKLEQKPFALQFFGSTVERFPENHIPERKAKSFYNIKSQIGKNRSFNKSQHAFMYDTSRRPQFLNVNEKDKAPGPGHYKQNVTVQKKLKGNKLQKFGSNTKRMFQQQDNPDQVGPGKYDVDQKKVQNPKNLRFGQVTEVSSNFRSTTNRDCFGNNRSQKIPFAQYDVSQYDLAKKLQKQKNFIQNLKKIDVQKPPFESTISRFPHYQQRPKNDRRASLQQNRQQQIKLRQEQQKIREMILQANHNQVKDVYKSYFGKQERFKGSRKGAPPVGHYSLKANWQRKSHNVKYQNK